uniref:Phosphoribosylformylglycinamidine synthase subunit PurQ n=1 Tax=candidate division WOR-3 bacterium TaxID=2052148 RepID=A0A7C4Y704_UNCW3
MVKVLIFRGPGTNCDKETEYAFKISGANVESVYIKRLIENKKILRNSQIIAIPGGFTFGDDLGAGKVFSILLKNFLFDELSDFIQKGNLIIGICNGFQILVKTGILPDLSGKQSLTLTTNKSGMFYDGWVKLKVVNRETPFLIGIDEIYLPVANKEGRLIFKDDESRKKIIDEGLIALKYDGFNPSGSELDIAGITDRTGRILGLMPHPERNIFEHSHPEWKKGKISGEGLKIFKNAIQYFR